MNDAVVLYHHVSGRDMSVPPRPLDKAAQIADLLIDRAIDRASCFRYPQTLVKLAMVWTDAFGGELTEMLFYTCADIDYIPMGQIRMMQF